MFLSKTEIGKRGEDAALSWLEARGFCLRDRNWRCGHRELDLVVESAGRVHIVEVKTLTPPLRTEPAEKGDARKQASLTAAASRYIAQRRVRKEVQFDIVSVILSRDGAQVEQLDYIPNAFYPVRKCY